MLGFIINFTTVYMINCCWWLEPRTSRCFAELKWLLTSCLNLPDVIIQWEHKLCVHFIKTPRWTKPSRHSLAEKEISLVWLCACARVKIRREEGWYTIIQYLCRQNFKRKRRLSTLFEILYSLMSCFVLFWFVYTKELNYHCIENPCNLFLVQYFFYFLLLLS